jgi:hypothetical protein
MYLNIFFRILNLLQRLHWIHSNILRILGAKCSLLILYLTSWCFIRSIRFLILEKLLQRLHHGCLYFCLKSMIFLRNLNRWYLLKLAQLRIHWRNLLTHAHLRYLVRIGKVLLCIWHWRSIRINLRLIENSIGTRWSKESTRNATLISGGCLRIGSQNGVS